MIKLNQGDEAVLIEMYEQWKVTTEHIKEQQKTLANAAKSFAKKVECKPTDIKTAFRYAKFKEENDEDGLDSVLPIIESIERN